MHWFEFFLGLVVGLALCGFLMYFLWPLVA